MPWALQKSYARNVARDFDMLIWYLVLISLAPKAGCFNHNEINCPGHREKEMENNVITETPKPTFLYVIE